MFEVELPNLPLDFTFDAPPPFFAQQPINKFSKEVIIHIKISYYGTHIFMTFHMLEKTRVYDYDSCCIKHNFHCFKDEVDV